MLRLLLTVLKHRVTWRFLLVLAATLGYSSYTNEIGQLATAFCSLLSCSD